MSRGEAMEIYFVRHGEAEDGAMGGEGDAARRLTAHAVRGMKQEGEALSGLGVKVDKIISSPLARAVQTAELLREALQVREPISSDPRLEPGFSAEKLDAILAELPGFSTLMLVGHEPSFSRVVGEITGGSRLKFEKGGVARVTRAEGPSPAYALAWLLPPRLLRD